MKENPKPKYKKPQNGYACPFGVQLLYEYNLSHHFADLITIQKSHF